MASPEKPPAVGRESEPEGRAPRGYHRSTACSEHSTSSSTRPTLTVLWCGDPRRPSAHRGPLPADSGVKDTALVLPSTLSASVILLLCIDLTAVSHSGVSSLSPFLPSPSIAHFSSQGRAFPFISGPGG